MKIYISVDMEGIGGIVVPEQVTRGKKEYEEARYLLIREVNAVVDGALEGGATEIIVQDAHSSGFNFPIEELHPEAKFIIGGPHPRRFPLFDESIDGFFLIGYHAKSGTQAAVRDHTMSSATWQEFRLNDMIIGEVGIDASIAGYFNVPVILVTGDDKVCAESRELLGDIETAVVKEGIGRHSALLLPPVKSRELVKEKAKAAIKKIDQVKPFVVKPPITVQLRYVGTHLVDAKSYNGKDIVRIDGQTLLYKGDDLLEVYRKVGIY